MVSIGSTLIPRFSKNWSFGSLLEGRNTWTLSVGSEVHEGGFDVEVVFAFRWM